MPKLLLIVLVLFCGLPGCLSASETDMGQDADADFRPGLAVPVLSPTEGAWVNDNTWGDQFNGTWPLTEGVSQQIVKNSRFYGPPAVHSVSLFRSDDRFANNAEMRARITYGSGGVQNEFFCDWSNGLQLNLVANTITVGFVTYAPNGDAAYNANGAGKTFLGALLGSGTAGTRGESPTYTEPSLTLQKIGDPGSNDVTYNAPDFAVAVRVWVFQNNDPSVPTGIDVQLNAGSYALGEHDAQVCAGGQAIPLPGGVSNVHVTNVSDAAQRITVQWVLGL